MTTKYKVKITLDQNICIACGVCGALHPQAFKYDPTVNKYKVSKNFSQEITVDKAGLKLLQQASDACPVNAIQIKIIKEI